MTAKQYCSKIEPSTQGKKELSCRKRIHFASIDSTNNWAKENPEQWNAEGLTLVTASEQFAGRGRFKRQWVSPPDVNIYATFCLWLDPKREDIGHIPQLLALVVANVLEQHNFFPQIKWPNDILLQSKKVAGILCEAIYVGEHRGVVCGIGLNVNMGAEELNKIDRPATSLAVEAGHLLEVDTLLESLTEQFAKALAIFMADGFTTFFLDFQKRSSLKQGDIVRFHDNQSVINAHFEALCPNGAVLLKLASGQIKAFYAGEFN